MLKSLFYILALISLSLQGVAQQQINMRNLWVRPQVHVSFGDYTLSYTIKDINKALSFLNDLDKALYGSTSNLDTNKDYWVELFPGTRTDYRYRLQPMIQNGVGAYLLLCGHAEIQYKKHKKVKTLEAHLSHVTETEGSIFITFYDPRTKKMVFEGKMENALYNKDLGID